jgi:hypothetical protein
MRVAALRAYISSHGKFCSLAQTEADLRPAEAVWPQRLMIAWVGYGRFG